MKKMLINDASQEESRVAIIKDGLLQEIGIEAAAKEQIRGNIYKGKVTRIEPRLRAAFVQYGGPRNGFLPQDEIHPRWTAKKEKHNGPQSIKELLKKNQEILVQVVQEERGSKGAMLTTYISVPGRYLVLMPFQSQTGVSKKIDNDDERERLKKIVNEINREKEIGCIVRTAGDGHSKGELSKEYRYILRLWSKIWSQYAKVPTPFLLYQESDLAIRTIRDYFTPDIGEIVCDNPDMYVAIKDFIKLTMSRYAKKVKLYKERLPLFSFYHIEEQLESIYDHRVDLKSGGSIVIDPTEALVAVDVNTGKTQFRAKAEEIVYRTNMEAAVEIARQLRLRDLGGLIVIDFIDMEDRKHLTNVERCLRDAFKGDKAKVKFSKISRFGLLEMSRQRLHPALQSSIYVPCQHCDGSGSVKSLEAQALYCLRKIQTMACSQKMNRLIAEVPRETAHYLLNEKRETLIALEKDNEIQIEIKGEERKNAHDIHLQFE
jgi:ribonuclease E